MVAEMNWQDMTEEEKLKKIRRMWQRDIVQLIDQLYIEIEERKQIIESLWNYKKGEK